MKWLSVCLVGFTTSLSRAETWKIVTLDWPPYTTEAAADRGAAAKAFAEAMATVDVNVEYVFLPWTRAVKESQKKEIVGLFPVWENESKKGRKISPLLFTSPLVVVHHKERPVKWKSLQDFKGLNVGIVDGYGYPGAIVENGKKGLYSLSTVGTDEQILRMLNFKRIDVTVTDLYNARHLSEIRFPELRQNLTIDPTIFNKAGLYLSLKNDGKLAARIAKIELALKKAPMQPRVDQLVSEIFQKASQSETE